MAITLPLPSQRRLRRFASFVAVAVIASIAHAQNRLPNRLTGIFQGESAIASLGVQLPAVAEAHGLQPHVLTTLFRTQKGLVVDRDGSLLFVCEGPGAFPGRTARADEVISTPASSLVTSPDGDPFLLHSFPGATRVIYLDFNGHTTTGTPWNSNFTGGAPIVSQPFDIDGSPGTFGTAEQTLIRRVWQRVAEDYAPFAVDVTTEDPGVEALRRTSPTDTSYGVRVVISPTNWYSSSAGGVAYIRSFNWNSDTPCFAFTAQLANGEKYIAESAAHETGHTLGLYHDGLGGPAPTEYYQGQGNWAPTMGVSYYKPITQFSRGEYLNANNTQDDFAVMATFVPLASDDHGDSLATATFLAGPNVSNGGTIERSSDVDLFQFVTGAGVISLNVQGPSPEPNLDLHVELLGAAGQVLQTSNPSTLNATITATVASGTYYLRVSGVGAGDPVTNGYSNYGSLGNYVITGSLATTTSAPSAPSGLVASAGDAKIDLDWSPVSQASGYSVKRSTVSGGPYSTIASNLPTAHFTDLGLSNGTPYYYVVTASNAGGESANSAQATATPIGAGTGGDVAYVTGTVPGTLRNNYDGWVGMQIVVGMNSLTVSQLGRMMAPGNNGTHTVKLVRASDGMDVPGGSATVAMSGGTVGQFQYGMLGSPVTLAAGTTYWLVSREAMGGDSWHDANTTVTTTSAAQDTAVVWGSGPGDWHPYPVANQTFVPVNFKYAGAAPTVSTYVIGTVPGTLRNNYGGWVGMQIEVGANPLTVSQLGRMAAPGNSDTHTVKLVKASDGMDVPGGAVAIAMSGATTGEFRYGTLSSPVVLAAGTTYWILSQEMSGGDSWYDANTTVTTTSVALDTAVVWGSGPGDWHPYPVANQTFVPVNFKY